MEVQADQRLLGKVLRDAMVARVQREEPDEAGVLTSEHLDELGILCTIGHHDASLYTPQSHGTVGRFTCRSSTGTDRGAGCRRRSYRAGPGALR